MKFWFRVAAIAEKNSKHTLPPKYHPTDLYLNTIV